MDETLLDTIFNKVFKGTSTKRDVKIISRQVHSSAVINRQTGKREKERERERERVCKFRAGPCMYHRDTRRLRRDSLSRILVSQSFSDCILPLVVPPLARAADKRLLSIHFLSLRRNEKSRFYDETCTYRREISIYRIFNQKSLWNLESALVRQM